MTLLFMLRRHTNLSGSIYTRFSKLMKSMGATSRVWDRTNSWTIRLAGETLVLEGPGLPDGEPPLFRLKWPSGGAHHGTKDPRYDQFLPISMNTYLITSKIRPWLNNELLLQDRDVSRTKELFLKMASFQGYFWWCFKFFLLDGETKLISSRWSWAKPICYHIIFECLNFSQ